MGAVPMPAVMVAVVIRGVEMAVDEVKEARLAADMAAAKMASVAKAMAAAMVIEVKGRGEMVAAVKVVAVRSAVV